MSSINRANRIDLLFKSLKKHFKPVLGVPERSVLEQLIYACCLEDARYEAADEAFAKIQQSYFDWNEVRVTTVAELTDALSGLPNPSLAGSRIKRNLQSIFETRYAFEIEDMRKMNLGKAIAELERWGGGSRYVVSYVAQYSLGGHAIPLSQSTIEILRLTEIVTDAEADKGQAPGLERAVPKSKGLEFASLLHQMGAEFNLQPKTLAVQAVFKDLGVSGKRKPVDPPPPPKKAPAAIAKKPLTKSESQSPPPKPSKSAPVKKTATKKPAAVKKIAPAKKAKPVKPQTKSPTKKLEPAKKTKTVAAKKPTKRKPK